MFRFGLPLLLLPLLVMGYSGKQFLPFKGGGKQFSPPQIRRGDPIGFPADFDLSPWISKTTDTQLWFKENGNAEIYIDWDAARAPFDLIVIHHTAGLLRTKAKKIDSLQKQRLYEPRYQIDAQPRIEGLYVEGLPVHSAHVINGRERFIAYHHLVYDNGKITTELSPLIKIDNQWYVDHVAWHSGQWSVNCRSIAICLVGDYTNSIPPNKQLKAVKKLIDYYRQFNPNLLVKPHKAFNPNTECPGNKWEIWGKQIQ